MAESGQPVSLAGPSLFWSNDGWEGEAFYNARVVATVAQDWRASVIRAAIGVDNNGSYIETPNIIYEVYNEPINNTDWDSVIKPYAESVIAAIRNIAYALHFYARSIPRVGDSSLIKCDYCKAI